MKVPVTVLNIKDAPPAHSRFDFIAMFKMNIFKSKIGISTTANYTPQLHPT